MAYTDDSTGGRVIEQGIGPVEVTLGAACEVGDLLCYNSGWVLADASASNTSAPRLVAGVSAANGEKITAYQKALVSSITTGTAGNEVYLSDTAGGTGNSTGTIPYVAGFELGSSKVYLDPDIGGYRQAAAVVQLTSTTATVNARVNSILTALKNVGLMAST